MSQLFISNVLSFEANAKETTYTVYVITSSGNVEPAVFSSKSKAVDFARDFTDDDSQVFIYKSKCIKVLDSPLYREYSSHGLDILADAAAAAHSCEDHGLIDYQSNDDEDYDPKKDNTVIGDPSLDGLSFETYGRGYLLTPSEDCDFYGEPYLLNGWWNDSANGWFFKNEFYDELVENGAVYMDTSGISHKTNITTSSPLRKNQTVHGSSKNKSKDDLSTVDLSGFTITRYGKGYIVTGSKSNPHMKAKSPYLVGKLGWWNDNANGWFFQKGMLKDLRRAGATMIKTEQLISQDINLTGMTIVDYGKGHVVTGPVSHKLMRSKSPYLVGKLGWWNKSANGWFFQSKYIADLERLGAVREGTIVVDDSEGDYVCDDSQFGVAPTFERYGKGWMLYADSKYNFNKLGKYFEGGFWMPQQNGWFYKNDAKISFLSKY